MWHSSVVLAADYPVKSFGGTKSVVLSTTSWMGGKNAFLGICYLCVGAISLVLALVFSGAEKFGFVKRCVESFCQGAACCID